MGGVLTRQRHPFVGGSVPTLQTLLFLLATSSLVSGQAYTICNPLQVKCPPAPGFPSSQPYMSDFRHGPDDRIWTSVGHSSEPITYSSPSSRDRSSKGKDKDKDKDKGKGATFTIKQSGDSPVLESDQYIHFGTVEVHLRAAPGRGIVSCVVLLSDSLDEIDWEWLGGEEHVHSVQSNYFGKGETGDYDHGEVHAFSGGETSTGSVHNYTIDWDRERIVWFIDGVEVRRLKKEDAKPRAVPGRSFYPQTPARVRIGVWAGGDRRNPEGTISWAGGVTDFGKGPYEMVVEFVRIVNKYPAESYWFRDFSGAWEGIEGLREYHERGDRGEYEGGYGELIEGGYVFGYTYGGYHGGNGAGRGDHGDVGYWGVSGTGEGKGMGYGNGHGVVEPGSVGTGGTRDGGVPGIPDRPNGTPVVNLAGGSSEVVRARLDYLVVALGFGIVFTCFSFL